MALTYWIQNADISTAVSDEPVKSANQILEAFDSFDWQGQLTLLQGLQETGQDNCPPGLGVVRESGIILHLCPQPDGTVSGFWHTRKVHKMFGIFRTTQSDMLQADNISTSLAREAIVKFVKGDDEWLRRNFKDS